MGEYAKRNSDGQEIKIGTCEDMYYIRYEDRFKVSPLPGNVDISSDAAGCRFRLPFPDEDGVLTGEYEKYNRGLRMYRPDPCEWCKGSGKSQFEVDGNCRRCHGAGTYGHSDFTDPEMLEDPGTIQLHHPSGLLLNVPCYHGMKLPEVTAPMKAFWNGKSWSTELSSLRVLKGENGFNRVVPVVGCVHCGQKWRYEWADVWDFIEPEMQRRLEKYRNPTVTEYTPDFKTGLFTKVQ